jgi:hypothetical protein
MIWLGEFRDADVRPTAQARGRRNDRHAGDGAVRSPGNQYDHRAGWLRVGSSDHAHGLSTGFRGCSGRGS